MAGSRLQWRTALLACVLAAASAAAAFGDDSSGLPASCVHELTYSPAAGLILVSVTIAGSPPLTFVLDSGATQSALTDPFLARALGLEVRDVGLARGIGAGATRVLVTDEVPVLADGKEILLSPLVVHDIGEQLAELTGRDIDGFLGADLFERYVVVIDPGSRTLSLYDPLAYVHAGSGVVLALEVENRRPIVEAAVTVESGARTLPVRLMVDTGSSRNLTLISRSRRHLKPPAEGATSASVGVVGPTEVLVAPVARLELGTIISEGLETSWVGAHQVPAVRNIRKLNGILGNGLLSRLRTTFDYGRRALVFERPRRAGAVTSPD